MVWRVVLLSAHKRGQLLARAGGILQVFASSSFANSNFRRAKEKRPKKGTPGNAGALGTLGARWAHGQGEVFLAPPPVFLDDEDIRDEPVPVSYKATARCFLLP